MKLTVSGSGRREDVLFYRFAGLAELADAPDSKSGDRKVV
jgi:hypothetical protein